MTRYVADREWLDVDQQNVAVGTDGNQAQVVLPLSLLTAVQLTVDDQGGALTMVFGAPAKQGSLVSSAQEMTLEFNQQWTPAFQTLGGWLDQVVAINHHHGAPVTPAAAQPTQAPTADPLPVINPAGVPLVRKPGEVIHGVFDVELLKQTVQHEYQGDSAGFSFPLGHGVRLRTGSMRGHSVAVGSQMTVQDTGQLVVTSTRTVFIGHLHSLEFAYPKLVGLRQYNDGLGISVSNRQTASVFRVANHESPALAVSLISRSAA